MKAFDPFLAEGILIEGVDYAGKTTLASGLADELVRRGFRYRHAREVLSERSQIQSKLHAARRLELGFDQDLAFVQLALEDSALPPGDDGRIVIQDRQWLSALGHMRFFQPSYRSGDLEALRRCHTRFRFNVYLASSLEAKRERIRAHAPVSALDRFLAANPDVHQRYDDFMRAVACESGDWLVLDTSTMNAEEVLAEVTTRMPYRCARIG